MQTAIPGALTDSPLAVEIAEPRAEHFPAHPAPIESPPLLATTISVRVVAGSTAYEATKRALDLVLGIVGLALTGLASIVVVPLVLSSSPGPAIFRQTRLGRGGKPFTCYKFRTMDADAEARLAHDPELGARYYENWKIENDPRIIRFGRFLRKSSIDELPQFWNVVRGEMSLVGPRPVQIDELHLLYPGHSSMAFGIKPGITGLWQVAGRSSLSSVDRVALDLEYVKTRSSRLDLWVLLRTIPAVLRWKNAC